ncbi:MAG TPA: hypothetical protein IGS52_18970 [Oscillatoriaceae cyanobacterium M33_DOE_052]|uniref:Uncharacterized protein n=1 Tax=Planktothricoides sp. SpSt-374 TaxID=2282167 RepID=A0A7C3VU56_9CYAN|nr:hypothetical protein [Oscillatoriaceae cyanobacterium M33_DOE_052]
MRLMLGVAIAGLLLWGGIAAAEITNYQVVALVEALRLAAPQGARSENGLYSDWKIKPANIPRWSRLCIEEELTPEQFEADYQKAREILVCVMDDVLRTEYPASGGDEAIAIRRAAAWWVAGDPNLYDSGDIRYYTNKVLGFYQELRAHPTDFFPH